MSYIVPRDKPQECSKCHYINQYNDCRLIWGSERIRTVEEQYQHCPLIEVPPHGRLIDIKSVEDNKFAIAENDLQRWWNGAIDSIIDNAPTVIEADGERDERYYF